MNENPGSTMRQSTTRGFKPAAALLAKRIRHAGESRGFAVSRVLTHWAEIAGADLAQICRPVEVRYNRGGFGATLSLLTTGAQAPMLEMQKEDLRQRVNAVYGYNAISRVRITQTAPTGFAEGQAAFTPRPAETPARETAPAQRDAARKAAELSREVADAGLQDALERLGQNVLSTAQTRKGMP